MEKRKVLYTKEKQWHIDPEVRFIDACVALGLWRERVEPIDRAREVKKKGGRGRKRHGEKGRRTAKKDKKTFPSSVELEFQTQKGSLSLYLSRWQRSSSLQELPNQ